MTDDNDVDPENPYLEGIIPGSEATNGTTSPTN